jgi:hypothetical protein
MWSLHRSDGLDVKGWPPNDEVDDCFGEFSMDVVISDQNTYETLIEMPIGWKKKRREKFIKTFNDKFQKMCCG